jgi:hypothetical protein
VADQQDTYELRVRGEEELNRLNTALKEQRKLLQDAQNLSGQLGGMGAPASMQAPIQAQARAAAEQVVTLKQDIAALRQDLAGQEQRTAMQQMGGRFGARMAMSSVENLVNAPFQGGNAVGNALMQGGNAAELMAMMNSSMTMPQFAAVTGGIAAMRTIITHFAEIAAFFKGQSLKDLEEAAKKVARAAEEFKKLRETPRPSEVRTAQPALEGMAEFGEDKLATILEGQFALSAPGMSGAEMQQFVAQHPTYSPEDFQRAIDQEQMRHRTAAGKAEAQRLMLDAQKPGAAGQAARARLKQLQAKIPALATLKLGPTEMSDLEWWDLWAEEGEQRWLQEEGHQGAESLNQALRREQDQNKRRASRAEAGAALEQAQAQLRRQGVHIPKFGEQVDDGFQDVVPPAPRGGTPGVNRPFRPDMALPTRNVRRALRQSRRRQADPFWGQMGAQQEPAPQSRQDLQQELDQASMALDALESTPGRTVGENRAISGQIAALTRRIQALAARLNNLDGGAAFNGNFSYMTAGPMP